MIDPTHAALCIIALAIAWLLWRAINYWLDYADRRDEREASEILSSGDLSIIGDGAVTDWTPIKKPPSARIRDIEPRGA